MSKLPAPLAPPGVNLRSFPFMPLDVARLRESDLTALATGDEFRAAVLLWCAAWHQIPAGSLPDDDKTLAHLAGFGRNLDGWAACRKTAMRGFVKCSDQRLYHPVICEKVLEAMGRSEAGKAGAKGRWQKRKPDIATAKRPQCDGNATDTTLRKRKKERKKEKPPAASPAAPARGQRRAEADAHREATQQSGKYRSEMTPKERKVFDREIEKLLAEGRAMARPGKQPPRRSTHVAMMPDEREAGLQSLAQINAAQTAVQPRRRP